MATPFIRHDFGGLLLTAEQETFKEDSMVEGAMSVINHLVIDKQSRNHPK